MVSDRSKAMPKRRRLEPGRRSRLIDVTIRVIAEEGAAATTHRLVAKAANVPLASTTYYFSSLDDLIFEAFRRYATNHIERYKLSVAATESRYDLLATLTELLIESIDDEPAALAVELYSISISKPAFEPLADFWIRGIEAVLRTRMTPATARAINALTEGYAIHKRMAARSFSAEELNDQLEKLLPAEEFGDYGQPELPTPP